MSWPLTYLVSHARCSIAWSMLRVCTSVLFISSEATTAQCSQRLLNQQCQGEIVLHPADEGQKPKTAIQGLHLLSFGTVHLIFSCTYSYELIRWLLKVHSISGWIILLFICMMFLFIYCVLCTCREVVQELTDEYIASTRHDYISRGSAEVRMYWQ